jgi:hypothetical protein
MAVKRASGDLISYRQGRWADKVELYRNLEWVKLVLPWSTP